MKKRSSSRGLSPDAQVEFHPLTILLGLLMVTLTACSLIPTHPGASLAQPTPVKSPATPLARVSPPPLRVEHSHPETESPMVILTRDKRFEPGEEATPTPELATPTKIKLQEVEEIAPPLNQATPSPEGQAPPSLYKHDERINILLLGIDKLPHEQYGRTDTMILVTVDPISETAGLLSIPRDLWVSIPGYGQNRINNAYFLGEKDDYPGGGPALAMETVQNALGVPVHFYALVDFAAFRQLVDTLDGIEVCVSEAIDKFEAGWQTLDGDEALSYVRTRASPTADFARVQRQQAVLFAMRNKALQIGIIPKIPQLWRMMFDTVDTNLHLLNIFRLAGLANTIELPNVRFAAIDHTMTVNHITPQGAEVLLPLYDKIKVVVDEMFAGVTPAEGSTLINALDWSMEQEGLCLE